MGGGHSRAWESRLSSHMSACEEKGVGWGPGAATCTLVPGLANIRGRLGGGAWQ